MLNDTGLEVPERKNHWDLGKSKSLCRGERIWTDSPMGLNPVVPSVHACTCVWLPEGLQALSGFSRHCPALKVLTLYELGTGQLCWDVIRAHQRISVKIREGSVIHPDVIGTGSLGSHILVCCLVFNRFTPAVAPTLVVSSCYSQGTVLPICKVNPSAGHSWGSDDWEVLDTSGNEGN